MSDAQDKSNVGNVLSEESAQSQYYKLLLMKEKMLNAEVPQAMSKKILGSRSELDVIELDILANISDITESSPEFAQLVDITGKTNKYDMATWLAKQSYDKRRANLILETYTPDKHILDKTFTERQTLSMAHRQRTIQAQSTRGTASPLAEAARTASGTSAPASGL